MMKKLSFVLLSVFLFACSNNNPAQEANNTQESPPSAPGSSTTVTTQNPNWETVVVGSELNFPPFEFKDEQSQATGFEIELLSAVAKAGEFNVEIINSPRETFTDELNKEKVALFVSALTNTKDRAEKVDFSEPFLDYRRQLYFLDTPENANLQKPEDFLGKTIASDRSFNTAQKAVGDTGTLVKVDSFALALKELYAKKVDVVIADNRTLAYFDRQAGHSGIKTRSIALDDKDKQLVFAVNKGNQVLLDKVNKGLASVKQDGTLDALIAKWFVQQ